MAKEYERLIEKHLKTLMHAVPVVAIERLKGVRKTVFLESCRIEEFYYRIIKPERPL